MKNLLSLENVHDKQGQVDDEQKSNHLSQNAKRVLKFHFEFKFFRVHSLHLRTWSAIAPKSIRVGKVPQYMLAL